MPAARRQPHPTLLDAAQPAPNTSWGDPAGWDDLYTPAPPPPLDDGLFMTMPSGRRWIILAPDPADIHWPDVAEMLAKEPRFAGATLNAFYSVAQHLCLCHDHTFAASRAAALHHDDHEIVVRDLPSPVKKAQALLGGGEAYARLCAIQDAAIHAAAGIPWPLDAETAADVHHIDLTMLATEVRSFFVDDTHLWAADRLPPPLPIAINPWPWTRAADEWLARVRRHLPR